MRQVWWLCGTGVLALAACGQQPKPKAPPPPVVDVVTVSTTEVPNIIELPGRIEPVRFSEVRARTDGIVLRRLYEEGQSVREGTPLFQLDPRDYRAQVAQSQAAVARYAATRANAAAVVRRYAPLAERRAVSAQEFDQARSDLAQADAQVAEARATLSRSQLQLGYTTIRSPITGVVGRAEVTEGALVSASQATLLTRVDQVSPVYAVFSASSASILETTQDVRSGALTVPSMSSVRVKLILENGQEYAPIGTLDFTSPVVDPSTGSQLVRARFPNAERLLKPGQFVTARIFGGTISGGIVVPAGAVQMKGDQASVLLVTRDGKAASAPVSLGQLLATGWIIKSGLNQGDRLIVKGWQKARPGQAVTIRRTTAAATASTALPASGR